VKKEHYQDPGTDDPNWLAVDLKPFKKLKNAVSLAQIKADPRLQEIQLVKLSRLSVASIKPEEFDIILSLSESKKP
jgi:predicted RNA-binding protein with PUA-like domain